MKTLAQFCDFSNGSERIERKFIMSKGQAYLALCQLLKNGFKPHHEDRSVASIYFDTYDLRSLRDNVDGNPNRDKLRVRYYNNNVTEARLETKHKRAEIGYKAVFELPTVSCNEKELIVATQKWSSLHVFETMKPTARILYHRKYFIKGNCRATVDYDVCAQKISNNSCYTSTLTNYSVIEFKYNRGFDNDFRTFRYFNDIALRNTKCSKYANCMMN